MNRHAISVWATCLILSTVVTIGCTRGHYRLRADSDAYGRILEKSNCRPWQIPNDFSVYPSPTSRLHDPTCVNDPCLPIPSPQLYAYDLPAVRQRDPGRFRPQSISRLPADASIPTIAALPPVEDSSTGPDQDSDSLPGQTVFANVSYAPSPLTQAELNVEDEDSPPLDPTPTGAQDAPGPVVSVAPSVGNDGSTAEETDPASILDEMEENQVQSNQVALPPAYWESIPDECLSRMFEFQSVRDEYTATYGAPPSPAQRDSSPRLALEDIVELTLLNSRELQTQKEQLYRAALALTLERFDYQLKPSVGNNGSSANYSHNRFGGETVDRLRIPTTFQLEKMMYSGADFIGRFANDVLLTFNGPQGFAVDVGSELLFNFSQSLLQRDVRLENLTQAERNVVYAARDFTRFRRELFVQQASDYYGLIRTFRQIEIQCQNYFVLAREFNQRSVEIKFGMAARTQLDQVEQQVISGRQRILTSCTALENSLDSLKIRMGVPTEQLLNLDLSELNLITLSDELAVNAELINRTRRRILREIESTERSPFVVVGGVSQLAEQMIDSLRLRRALGEAAVDTQPLEARLLGLRIEAADIEVGEDQAELDRELADANPDPTKLIQRRRDVTKEIARKIYWQLRAIQNRQPQSGELDGWIFQYRDYGEALVALEDSFLDLIFREESVETNDNPEELQAAEAEVMSAVTGLQSELTDFAEQLDQVLGRTAGKDTAEFEARALSFADELMAQSEGFQSSTGGLVPIQIEMDDAMMTALVQRFDLMNQRGFLADDWRQIKFAADDLRSILNLNASHSTRTRSGENKPFEFTLDDSTTSASLSLDLPFNRRAQRNRFRTSLFDYQRTLRNVMQLEDNIKLSVRRDVRTLKLDRQQYINDVAGAALASERVTSTELEVRGGFATSRDFLESQTAYVQAISGVASNHINYIVGRLQLFLDLESLTVGDNGFWDELYDEQHQPEPYYQLPGYARPAYGQLHPCLKYSRKIQRMRCVPNGSAMVHEAESTGDASRPGAYSNPDLDSVTPE